VKVWIWKAYPDRAGVPGLKNPEARRTFFNECKKAGVVGLKIDFFDAESQEVQKFYEDALADAAKLHLMLDFHGANKPTGQSRTYPNEMSREGIRGLENGTSWARHNTTLLFTRYLAGHGDYTPLSLRGIVKGTTLTHQIATVAAFTSPFMCLAVDPEALAKTDIKTIIKDIPVVWDETIVLPQSKIGELAVLARRSGTRWYLSVLNGETAQSVKVNLSFLGKGSYKAISLEDAESEPSKTTISSTSYSADNGITIKMASGGGFLSVLSK
jgi:alpha-glucosidase